MSIVPAKDRHFRFRFAGPASAAWIVACLLASSDARADALVVTKAMRASTIAEVYVEREEVRAEIEVGAVDLKAFVNVLPDKLYERVADKRVARKARLKSFLQNDWVILADGAPLAGTVRDVLPSQRVVRDEITGDPVPVQPDDVENVVRITITYPLERAPSSLALRPPSSSDDAQFAAANIGFAVYHRGVAVNDFRYLSREETLDLDWDDPWHSRFRNRNLRRQFDSPAAAFLYVEHLEVRKEIVIRPKDLQQWVDLGLAGRTTIPVERQPEIKRLAAEFLAQKNPVTIDGRNVKGELDRVHFIQRTLRSTGVIDPPQELDVSSATLGVIFVFPVTGLPQEVRMDWGLFTPKLRAIPAATSDQAGGLPTTLTPDAPVLRWRNFLTNPKIPAMLKLPPPPAPTRIAVPIVSCLFAVILLGLAPMWLFSASRGGEKRLLIACGCCLIGGAVAFPFARVSVPNPFANRTTITDQQRDEILAGLLHNVYRSFDRRDEELVYDRLALSISGDMLTEVYLQTKRSMELERQGGARVKVHRVELLETGPKEATETGGFVTRTRWNAAGSVGHWGHTHQRTNQYQADFVIAPVDDTWKITRMDLLAQQRLGRPPVTAEGRTR